MTRCPDLIHFDIPSINPQKSSLARKILHKNIFKFSLLISLFFTTLTLITISLYTFTSPPLAHAQSYSLFDLQDVVSTDSFGAPAGHSISFQLPINAQPIIATDYVQINLPYFSGVTAATVVAGTYSGTPSYSVSGNIARVTGINVTPGKSIIISGIGAINPATEAGFQVTVSITEDENGLLVKNTATTYASMNMYRVQVSANIEFQNSRLRIEGYSAPDTYVIFTEGESVRGTDFAGADGAFAKVFPALPVETHTFTFYGIDDQNRTTTSKSITAYTPAYQQVTVSDQLLSPTISINSSEYVIGSHIHATGSAYPGSTITIFTDTPVRTYTASASAQGDWTYSIATTSAYTPGDYRIYTLATAIGGLQSLISPTILFTMTSSAGGGAGTPCGDIDKGDVNCDNIIDLTDFSILMYYWGTTNTTADINTDGIVDLTDFSIMMYYWGT
ncbi:dockerin type I domain-containing protein [Pseudomonadota bacterium]